MPSAPQSQPDATEEVTGAGAETHEEVNEDQVKNDPEGARDAVLGLAEHARVVGDLLLGDLARGGDGGQPGRDEAVHLAIQTHVLDGAGAEGLEGTAVVLQVHAGDAGDQAVGDLGGDLAQDHAVLAVLAPAGHQVEIFAEQTADHARNVDGVVLEVAVHGDDDVAAGRVEPRLHGRGLLEVAHQGHDAYVGAIAQGRLLEIGHRVVR
jgi:hypothetical protein